MIKEEKNTTIYQDIILETKFIKNKSNFINALRKIGGFLVEIVRGKPNAGRLKQFGWLEEFTLTKKTNRFPAGLSVFQNRCKEMLLRQKFFTTFVLTGLIR